VREIRNAKITSTFLGNEDHGIPTFFLHLDYGGSAQGFGGYDLRFFGYSILAEIMKTVGVESWEKLPGKHLRADTDWGKVHRIGNLLRDEWLDPSELANKTKAAA
jgi:hypothetical protein